MYKLKRIKPKIRLIPNDLQFIGNGIKLLNIPHSEKDVFVIAYQAGLRVISSKPLSNYNSLEFFQNDFSQLDLSQIGINANMLVDAGLSINMESSFFPTNDQPNEYVLDTEKYLDGTTEGLSDCFIAIIAIPKQFNYYYELQGRNVLIGYVNSGIDDNQFFSNLYPPTNNSFHSLLLAGNIDFQDFETDTPIYPVTDNDTDLITLQRI